MKTLFISIIAGMFCWSVTAQTADDWVNQGLSSLSAQDLTDANNDFAQALAISSTNENANALYAITRLLVLSGQPAGSNFLSRIGIPASGRNLYNWTADVPEDANGVPLAPRGVNADEFTAQLRTNVLNSVIGAVGNLSGITNTNFTINLTSSETSSSAVTVDYGDLKLIQAGLNAAEYFIYTLNAQNVDAQLTTIRTLYTNGNLSAQSVLTNYPQLLTFATTNDLLAARAAFTNAVNCYMIASAYIHARPANEVRLFNLDTNVAAGEAELRSVLQDLEDSLVEPQVLAADTNLTVNMATQFTGSTTWRSLLPVFDGNALEAGVNVNPMIVPDVTFGGLIAGLTQEEVENYLGKHFELLVTTLPSNFTTLYSFTVTSGYPYWTNSDGANPEASLILSGNTLYGTGSQGGIYGYGNVFKVNTDGSDFESLHSFNYNDGNIPEGTLILSGNTLYGATENGGGFDNGTIFGITTGGTYFTNLHVFTQSSAPFYTNSDGADPSGGLILSGNTLYGTTDWRR